MSSKNNFCRYGMLIKRGNEKKSSYSHLSHLNLNLYTRFFLWLRLITRGYHVKLHGSRTLLHAQNTVFAIHAGHFAQSTKIGAGSKQRLLVRCMWITGLMCHERARLQEIILFYFLQNIEFQCRVSPPKPFLGVPQESSCCPWWAVGRWLESEEGIGIVTPGVQHVSWFTQDWQ